MAGLITSEPVRAQGDRSTRLIDGCGRRIGSLRVSVTDACDLRCIYCKPAGGSGEAPAAPLSDRQRVDFVRLLHDRFGIAHVRITGGEPLLYAPVVSLVASLRACAPDVTLAMTTSGRRLTELAGPLRDAGLDRLNISLDSLDPDRYRRITGGRLDDVLEGFDAAGAAGFAPAKINTVVMRGVNDRELVGLAEWGLSRGHVVRFLEAMPIGPAARANGRAFIPSVEVRARIESRFRLTPKEGPSGSTSRDYQADDGTVSGVIGFISPVSEPFCGDCSRIRLTAEGRLYPCLLDDRCIDLRSAWHAGELLPEEATLMLRRAIGRKQPRGAAQGTPMVRLGG